MSVKIMVDSGAHSLFMNVLRGKSNDKNYYKRKWFRLFFDEYMKWLHDHKDAIECYVGLDIIRNPKATYEVISEMWENGLDPIPVAHVGTDMKWVKKYMDKTGYIGVGGLGQKSRAGRYYLYADKFFGYICDKKTGRPSVKVHGFAMTTPYLLAKYPFYSIDSTTWAKMAGYGQVLVPTPSRTSGWNYMSSKNIGVTERSVRACREWSVHNMPPNIKRVVEEYFSEKNIELDSLSESHPLRSGANLAFFLGLEQDIKNLYAEKFNFPEGGNLYFATPGQLVDYYEGYKQWFVGRDIRLLPSYYYPLDLKKSRILAAKINNTTPRKSKLNTKPIRRRRLENGKD